LQPHIKPDFSSNDLSPSLSRPLPTLPEALGERYKNFMTPYPKRLIEVDLPIKRISSHARREKSIRHGHISTLHIWWARRPLAACRAVICAALWPAPSDPACPAAFMEVARREMDKWSQNQRLKLLGAESQARFQQVQKQPALLDDPDHLQQALLDFIADFANWDNSTQPEFLATSRTLTQAAHEALGGLPGTRPLVVDPFAGGGSIPLEALRVGADAFASDLNPVAVLLNKVVLEYIPQYGQRLADEVRKWGQWIKEQAEQELAEFYPKDPDGATPIAYLWARTIRCEGPGCGAEVPLMRSLWLAKKGKKSVGLRLTPNQSQKRVDFQIIYDAQGKEFERSTVQRGAATCPCCGYTTPVEHVRAQLRIRHGGATDSRLFAVVTTRTGQQGRFYRLPDESDLLTVARAATELKRRQQHSIGTLSLIPDEKLDIRGIRHTWAMIYGLEQWEDFFTPRQALALSTLLRLTSEIGSRSLMSEKDNGLIVATQICSILTVSKLTDLANSLCPWEPVAQCPRHLFARQATGMAWDFAEGVVIGESSGSFSVLIQRFENLLVSLGSNWSSCAPQQHSATAISLPDDIADILFTDPPYYDAVPYSYLSDFFYVWLRRGLGHIQRDLFSEPLVPKDEEIVVDRPHELSNSTHDIAFYERELTKAFAEGRRILRPDGVGTIVFASKTTASWEAILQAVVDAGWTITGSWPIDTEMETRVAAQGQARLASSIHLVCRPREDEYGSLRRKEVGDWRDVLQELPARIHLWLPRLAAEGVVGADAIFACLGPALEIFSRYSRVEKANGDPVALGEYLEVVWAAVSKEALAMVFAGADTSGFEEDARLTAMWLWTLSTGRDDKVTGGQGDKVTSEEADEGEEEEPGAKGQGSKGGYALEYDAARKIAQGLGAHLEQLSALIQVKGSEARLLPVRERSKFLFGQATVNEPAPTRRKAKQPSLFDALPEAQAAGWRFQPADDFTPGSTTLDRVHQSMLLFQSGRSEALKRFLVEQGIGHNERFWRLAQALSALYPPGSDEKRWVDGVLARKKGLGL
jgi:adenine-specific DNA methylase